MNTRDQDNFSAILNSKLIHMQGQMEQIKRHDSSASLADSGRGSSMGSRWSSRSSLHSNTSLLSNNSNTSRLRSFIGRGKTIVEEAFSTAVKQSSKKPKKDKLKKAKVDNQNRIGGNNFSQKPLIVEGAAEQDKTSNQNQVDFVDVKLVPENQCQIDSNGRRRKTSSSGSAKSFESGERRYIYKISELTARRIFFYYFRIIEC